MENLMHLVRGGLHEATQSSCMIVKVFPEIHLSTVELNSVLASTIVWIATLSSLTGYNL